MCGTSSIFYLFLGFPTTKLTRTLSSHLRTSLQETSKGVMRPSSTIFTAWEGTSIVVRQRKSMKKHTFTNEWRTKSWKRRRCMNKCLLPLPRGQRKSQASGPVVRRVQI
jgi:hypothetical protein